MKKGRRVLCAFLALLFFAFAADAGVITIKNATGFTIFEIYVSDSGSNDWEEDVLGQDVLDNGETLRLTINGSYRKFDMRAVDDDDNAVSWYGLPGNVKSITVYGDGTAEYR